VPGARAGFGVTPSMEEGEALMLGAERMATMKGERVGNVSQRSSIGLIEGGMRRSGILRSSHHVTTC